jgi:hypothetical protein
MTSETLHLCVQSLLVRAQIPAENAPPLDLCSDVRRKDQGGVVEPAPAEDVQCIDMS